MKNLILLLTVLCGAFNFSAHATTVVAEDTAEHTIQFTFGRPNADVYLCHVYMAGSNNSNLDIMTFPNGDKIIGDGSGDGFERTFTRETSPVSSSLHLGSENYGTQMQFSFCHDLQVPEGNPGGQIDWFYKITTPANWNYFSSSLARIHAIGICPQYGVDIDVPDFSLTSNTMTDYTLVTSVPFTNGEEISTDPSTCMTAFHIYEAATGPRPSNETAGNITLGVKDIINYN